MEVATSRHGPMPSASISPAVSATRSASRYSPGGTSEGETPLFSKVMTSYPAFVRAGT